jgi:acyl-CoA reductase-like NAD-dependent aldehyde dehydrogenase
MRAKIFFGNREIDRDEVRENHSPFNNQVVSYNPICNINDVDEILNIANISSKFARKQKLSQRCDWLLDVANKLSLNREDFAKTITDEIGKPISFSRIEVDRCIETIKLSAETMRTMNGETINSDAMNSGRETIAFWRRIPAGVVVAITPFNFPLNLVAHKIAPALVSGNSVILKPTPEAPLIAYKLAKLFIDSPFATRDALSLIYGDAEIGSRLVTSNIPRVISFTGSVQVGNIISRNAGIKKVALELGGNSGTFIDETADINFSAKRCAIGAFTNSGQVCISLQRIYVHKNIYNEFANALVSETSNLKIGNPYENETFMGPLISEDSVSRAVRWLNSAINEGAKALTPIIVNGRILKPVVMGNVRDDMAIVCEEVFAPIVSLIEVNNFDEAINKLNDSPYGLQFSIFTNNIKNMQKAISEFESGGILINEIPTVRFDIQPYGGIKLSGVGREGPRFAIEEFTEIQTVVIA